MAKSQQLGLDDGIDPMNFIESMAWLLRVLPQHMMLSQLL
jgi:hypothetical protein